MRVAVLSRSFSAGLPIHPTFFTSACRQEGHYRPAPYRLFGAVHATLWGGILGLGRFPGLCAKVGETEWDAVPSVTVHQ